MNTVTQRRTLRRLPAESFGEFKQIFIDSLDTAQLLTRHGDKIRIIDVSPDPASTGTSASSDRIKKLGKSVAVTTADSCFVMQPFALPLGDYYEKVYKPAIEKAGLTAIRADAEISLKMKAILR